MHHPYRIRTTPSGDLAFRVFRGSGFSSTASGVAVAVSAVMGMWLELVKSYPEAECAIISKSFLCGCSRQTSKLGTRFRRI